MAKKQKVVDPEYVIVRKDNEEVITKKINYGECLKIWNKIDSEHKIFEIQIVQS